MATTGFENLMGSESPDTRFIIGLNPNKSTKKDKNREKYIEDNLPLPPTVLPEPKSSISLEVDKIVLGL